MLLSVFVTVYFGVVSREETMRKLFAPGCALLHYKPELISKMGQFLLDSSVIDGLCQICCKSGAGFEEPVALITCCPGCSHMFKTHDPNVSVLSLWKLLTETGFPFPDYHGERMSIHDSCHARHRNSSEMQDSARQLCRRMNIELIEPEYTRDDARCCGGSAPDFETRKNMAIKRAMEFPVKDVVVYCTGCTRSFSITEVAPRHLLDLLFEEPTEGLYPPNAP